ncbi:HNH endonuclease [Aeromicrobium ponti]|uniref:Putative HNH nuclease YajD n=1 Tax=Cytobacillus oceanisediminis TaxID=665099 RepID=A0A562JCU3_9BACI|nr:HNH endonuclease [Cytobacillus oceanisediminis]TWH81006.1 HNH endonuclease [Cytobacillus oceanisediminis]
MKEINPFYRSIKWKSKREKILRRDEYLCRECKRYGKSTTATVIHHVFPLEHFPQYSMKSSNLYSCCNTCHNSFHDRDSHELTEKGKQLLERLKSEIVE